MNSCQALNFTETSDSSENFLGSSKFRVRAETGTKTIHSDLTFCICLTVQNRRFQKDESLLAFIPFLRLSVIFDGYHLKDASDFAPSPLVITNSFRLW